MAMITGTLADTIKPADSLPPEYMFDPNEDLILDDLWEGYDLGMRNHEKQMLNEAVSKSTCVFKYFLATVDNPEDRTFEKFNDSGYNIANLNRTDWNNNSFAAKKLTVDELKGRISKAEGKGNYSTPIMSLNGNKINPEDDNRADFNDEDDENASADDKLLRDLRNSIDEFNATEESIADIVHNKYDKIYQTAERIASGRSVKDFAFIYGMPGIGKSYTVAAAVKNGVKKWNTQKGPRPTIAEPNHGSIGTSPTALIVFFFKNRNHKVVILDDADGFLKSTNDDVQNIIKCLLDPAGYALTTPVTIRQLATKLYRKEVGLDESISDIPSKGVNFTVDTSRVDEGVLRYKIGGLLYECNVSEEEAKELKECFPMHKVTAEERKAYNEFKEAVSGKPLCRADGRVMSLQEQDSFIQGIDLSKITSDTMANAVVNDNGEVVDELADEIPNSFYFTSRMVMISNFNREDLNEAIQSRCDCIPIYLNREQFMFRAEEVLNWITISKTTLTEPELVDWAKRESFALFKACMNDLKYKNSKINMRIGIKLELRIIASLTGLLLARFDTWCEKNRITDYLKPEVYQRFEQEQKVYFIKYDLLPYMAGDLEADFTDD